MKAKLLLMLKTLLILLCFFPLQVRAQEVEYDFTKQDIVAQMSSDGSVKFIDRQTYQVDYFNGVYFELDREGYDVRDYRIGIENQETKEVTYFEENATGASGTFQLTHTNERYNFKVFYPTTDATVTFVFEYTLSDLITNFSDTAEFNRKIVGTGTSDTFDVSAVVILPGKVTNKEDFRAWAHGAPQGELELIEYEGKSAVQLTVKNNPPNQFVEVDTIFPTALTPNNQNRREVAKKAEIIARENAQVERDREAYATRIGWLRFFVMILAVLMPVSPLFLLIYYITKRRELNPNPVKLPHHIYELPEDITPAIMATSVFRNKPTTDDLTATIVDLARKKIIKLTPVTKEKRGLFSRGETVTIQVEYDRKYKDANTLKKHEQYALSYIMPQGKTITLQELEELLAKNNEIAKKQHSLWTSFVNFAEVYGMQLRGSTSEQSIAIGMGISATIAIPIMTIVGAILLSMTPYGAYILPLVVLGIGSLIFMIVLLLWIYFKPIQTAEQDRRVQEWTGFKNMLDDVGNFKMRDIASLELWEEFLVYAISLGVADKVVEAMKMQFKPVELDNMQISGGFYANPYLFTRVMNQSVQNSVSISQPRTTSNYSGSNTGGFGGGFSGGSSGGSGGGSGSGGF